MPDTTNPFFTSNVTEPQVIERVVELIDLATRDWNTQLIDEHFNSRDGGLMMQIHVFVNHPDQWYWRNDLNGLYSVRNGYKKLAGEALQLTDATSRLGTNYGD
nr:uncharacterized protein LOC109177267 [Ipomoea trifida]